MATNLDITIDGGADFAFNFIIKLGSNPVNLTGKTIVGQIKSEYGARSTSATFETLVTNASGGLARLELAGDVTRALPAIGVYDVLLRDNTSGDISKLAYGKVTTIPAVSSV
jgi:hypothetical protein